MAESFVHNGFKFTIPEGFQDPDRRKKEFIEDFDRYGHEVVSLDTNNGGQIHVNWKLYVNRPGAPHPNGAIRETLEWLGVTVKAGPGAWTIVLLGKSSRADSEWTIVTYVEIDKWVIVTTDGVGNSPMRPFFSTERYARMCAEQLLAGSEWYVAQLQ